VNRHLVLVLFMAPSLSVKAATFAKEIRKTATAWRKNCVTQERSRALANKTVVSSAAVSDGPFFGYQAVEVR
jgi:hypothetical protein